MNGLNIQKDFHSQQTNWLKPRLAVNYSFLVDLTIPKLSTNSENRQMNF